MSRQKRSIKENNDKLKVQLELLRSCTEHFDSCMIHMALPMATQFRVLIHQTQISPIHYYISYIWTINLNFGTHLTAVFLHIIY